MDGFRYHLLFMKKVPSVLAFDQYVLLSEITNELNNNNTNDDDDNDDDNNTTHLAPLPPENRPHQQKPSDSAALCTNQIMFKKMDGFAVFR